MRLLFGSPVGAMYIRSAPLPTRLSQIYASRRHARHHRLPAIDGTISSRRTASGVGVLARHEALTAGFMSGDVITVVCVYLPRHIAAGLLHFSHPNQPSNSNHHHRQSTKPTTTFRSQWLPLLPRLSTKPTAAPASSSWSTDQRYATVS